MSKYILLFSVFLFLNCNKRDECVDITDKKEINGLYYFYFTSRMKGLDGSVKDGYYSTTPS